MMDIIERLEKATGPDADLDGAICLTLGWTFEQMKGDRRPYFRRPEQTLYYQRSTAPRYTASIDAAMTLVPEGWRALIDCTPDDKPIVELFADEDTIRPIERGCAATPALALCIAALKAREQLG